jgi:hypothetical protein
MKLVIGLDGHGSGDHALAFAKDLAAHMSDCEIIVVYVIEWSPFSAFRRQRRMPSGTSAGKRRSHRALRQLHLLVPARHRLSRGSCSGWCRGHHLHRLFRLHPVPRFGHAIALVKGKYSDPNDAGEVSHFQALATALSGTVGLGNIAGVAVAVSIGGPGATFWMILAGLMGMASKFTECTLGVKYRNEYPDGTVSGGPMYYLQGLSEQGRGGSARPGDPVLDLLRARRARRRQHVPGQPGPCPDLGDRRRLSGLDHRHDLRRHRLRGHHRRHQVHRAGHREGRALHGDPLCRRGADHPRRQLRQDRLGLRQIFAGAFTGLGVAGGLSAR